MSCCPCDRGALRAGAAHQLGLPEGQGGGHGHALPHLRRQPVRQLDRPHAAGGVQGCGLVQRRARHVGPRHRPQQGLRLCVLPVRRRCAAPAGRPMRWVSGCSGRASRGAAPPAAAGILRLCAGPVRRASWGSAEPVACAVWLAGLKAVWHACACHGLPLLWWQGCGWVLGALVLRLRWCCGLLTMCGVRVVLSMHACAGSSSLPTTHDVSLPCGASWLPCGADWCNEPNGSYLVLFTVGGELACPDGGAPLRRS